MKGSLNRVTNLRSKIKSNDKLQKSEELKMLYTLRSWSEEWKKQGAPKYIFSILFATMTL